MVIIEYSTIHNIFCTLLNIFTTLHSTLSIQRSQPITIKGRDLNKSLFPYIPKYFSIVYSLVETLSILYRTMCNIVYVHTKVVYVIEYGSIQM